MYYKMKKKFFAAILSASLVFQLGIQPVYAEENQLTQDTNTPAASLNLQQSVSEELQNLTTGSTITINGVTATYKGDISNSGIQTTNADYKTDGVSNVYKAGNGYALLTWPKQAGGAYSLILHEVTIDTTGIANTDGISIWGKFSVTLEGENTIKASGDGLKSSNSSPTLIIGGEGTLSVEAGKNALRASYSWSESDTLIIQNGVRLTLQGLRCIESGTVTIKDSSEVKLINGLGTNDCAIYVKKLSVEDTAKVNVESEKPIGVITDTVNVGSSAVLNVIQQGMLSSSSWPHCVYGKITIPAGAALDLHSRKPLTVAEGASIINEGTLILPDGYSAAEIEALHITNNGTMKLDGKAVCFIVGKLYADGGEVNGDLNLSTAAEAVYYKSGSGYILFTPAIADASAMLTLHETSFTNGIILPNSPVTLSLEGQNYVDRIEASGALKVIGDIASSGTLDSRLIHNSDAESVFTINGDKVLNALYQTTKNNITTNTIYGNYKQNENSNGNNEGGLVVGTASKLVLTPQSVLTLSSNRYLVFKQNATLNDLTIGAGAVIDNKTYVTLPKGTTVEQIKPLPLTGAGVVRIATEYDANGTPSEWNTYTKDGKEVAAIQGPLTLQETEVLESAHAGYTWIKSIDEENEIWTLTLKNNYITGNVTLPNKQVRINTTEESFINGSIYNGQTSGGYASVLNAVFVGSAPLTISGGIHGSVDGDTVTVQEGAKVRVNGSISVGASGGANGTLNVTGAGTALEVSSENGCAVATDTVNIKNGASLIAKSQGEDSIGVEALSGVQVTDGSTLTAGCDYGVYIEGKVQNDGKVVGKLTVDDSSKLITNGAVAPFCIVDKTSAKEKSEVLALSGIPSGTEITSKKGSDAGYGYNYWSLVPKDGSLSVADENSTPVTLTGATKGPLSFVKAASNNNNGGSSNGGGTSGGGTSGGGNTGAASSSAEKKINLPKVLVDKLVAEQTKAFSITIDAKTLNLDLETLKIIQKQIDADATIAAKKIDNTSLSPEAKAVIGNRTVYDFTIVGINGREITDVGKGKISIVIPYTLDANEKAKNITAYAIDSAGKVQEVPNAVYDERNTKLSFVTDHFVKIGVGYKQTKEADITVAFTDIMSHWAKKDIEFVTVRGLFGGTSQGKFSPNMPMTRGMFVTVLARLAKADVSSYKESSFSDVSKEAYYMPTIEWASKKGIASGISENHFAPDEAITREQMAAIMANYAKMMDFDLPQIQAENIFADSEEITSYARTAVKQMQRAGLLGGKSGNKFEPQGTATRAEVSAVIKRFAELTEKR